MLGDAPEARHILDILRARVARGGRAPHDDGASIALAVEGGAMRGVVSAGMVWALEELGYTHAFDAVYGSSAGAINAAYFLAGQAGLGTRIYHEDINCRRFIDLSRPFRGRPIVDLSFLLDDVARRRKRLDVGRLLEGRTPLSVLATDVDSRVARVFGAFEDAEALFGSLRAGATMPVVAGAPYEHGGRRYLDASLSEPVPVPTAERRGHTHILALLTRTSATRSSVSTFDRLFVAPRLRRVSPELADRYLARAAPYTDLMRLIEAGAAPLGQARVLGIRVEGPQIGKLERRRAVLVAGAQQGYDAIMATFQPRGSTDRPR
jgi:predicted patatin/cPLA2 family phospholipase